MSTAPFRSFTTTDLAVLRAVAEHGSFTSAAAELGYTQSAISKRMAVLETTAGHALAIRTTRGVRLTRAGEILLKHATTALDAMEKAKRELSSRDAGQFRTVRLGAFASAAAGIVPEALIRLDRSQPDIAVSLREGTSAVLVRSLRAGSLDLALLADVAADTLPDDREQGLATEVLAEGPLRVAVGPAHRLAGRLDVTSAELAGERWVIARSERQERLLGVWPDSVGQPDAPYVVRDWLTKLRLVASGAAITTVPDVLIPALPADVRLINVRDRPTHKRRLLLARIAGDTPPECDSLADALRAAARGQSRPPAGMPGS
jgi:DNA-binding transcriptional LysR family regulator